VTADASARRSPLAGVRLPEGISERPFLAQLDLRLDPADEAACAAIESVIGPLPVVPNTFSGGPDASVLWLGPDEWLVVGPPGGERELESQLREALRGLETTVAIVDVSANRTAIELARPDGREILERGCPIDLERGLRSGKCAQTLLARANVIVQQLDDAPTYRLFLRPSFADYVAAWLTDAAEPTG
jgi:sarcosine oxidase subunit gamma